MVSADEILSIIVCVLFLAALAAFGLRYMRSNWAVYYFIMTFIVIRIGAYGLRAYLDSGAITPADSSYENLYIAELVLVSIGVVFIMKLIVRLYESILPKLRAQESQAPDLFEQCLVERTRFFIMPLVILVIAGAVLSTDDSESQRSLGLALRKVGVCLMMLLGLWYLQATYAYRQRYPANRKAFNVAFTAIALFDVTIVYKIIYTFYPAAQTATAAYFIFSPLLELIALGVLSVDLQAYFLGRPFDDDVEIQPTTTTVYYQPQPVSYQPPPVSYQPQSVNYQPQPFNYQSQPVNYQPQPAGY
ncbi:hypothetical protein BGZ49_001166 [Haplosporangium sp. Z 27]|nr:hypothetical protein BGZ49_001166 [Haplosporangium sp. Z 27]